MDCLKSARDENDKDKDEELENQELLIPPAGRVAVAAIGWVLLAGCAIGVVGVVGIVGYATRRKLKLWTLSLYKVLS